MTDAPSARTAELFDAAMRQHQAGRMAEAEALYRQVLAAEPGHPDALHGVGILAYQNGRLEEAADLIGRAVAALDAPEFLTNLGAVLHELGRFDEAAAVYRRALAKQPASPGAHNNLGNTLQVLGDPTGAEAAYRRAIELHANYPAAFINLGGLLQAQGRLPEAAAAFGRAAVLSPNDPQGHFHLGLALQAQGLLEAAATSYRRVIALGPNIANAHGNLGVVLQMLGRPAESEGAYRKALALEPETAARLVGLGLALQDQGKVDEAEAAYRRAVALAPGDPETRNNLGNVLMVQGRLTEAVAAYDEALALRLEYVEAMVNRAGALHDQGRTEEAAAAYDQAMVLRPDLAEAGGARLMSLHYGSAISVETLAQEHRLWGERHACPAGAAHANDRDPNRRLRVGFVSGDFRAHSVAYFFEPLLQARDRSAVEVFCYAQTPRPDRVTERLMGLADHWLFTVGMNDEALAQRIRADRIDVLVDLAGHTAGNRLGVFACKPAPVQATWLGYPNTTGLAAIDYRLVDAVTDPEGPADALAVETLVRLDGGFLCYAPPKDTPEVAPAPVLIQGFVTFGSFNNPAKLSDATVETWAELLGRVPDARLKLKGNAFADEGARELCLARFAAAGVAPERIAMQGWTGSLDAHLKTYGEVDVALDPFPYNGATTTCEALWMGVPVVCLMGERHSARVAASLLTRAGLEALIARDGEDYIAIAAGLAADAARLADLRASLRPRMAASPLCDAGAFARSFEAALRRMWRGWTQ